MAVPLYYPEDYGAVGDGVTQDHAAINAAITAASAATPRGGIVPLRKNYLIGAPIVMKNAVHLLGPGVQFYTNEAGPAINDPYTTAHVGQIASTSGYTGHMITSNQQGDWKIS